MTNLVVSEEIPVGDHGIEQVTKYRCLGHEIRFDNENEVTKQPSFREEYAWCGQPLENFAVYICQTSQSA